MRKIVLLCMGMCFLFAVGCGKNEGVENTQETIATESEKETEQEEIGEVDTKLLQWELFGSYIDDRPEIMCEDDEIVSFFNQRYYYMKPAANGSDYCYGLTFHKQTKEPIYLKDYIPSIQILIDAIEAEDYTVVYGEFFAKSKEEIIQMCKDYLEGDWDKHYSNFYVDNESLYIIVQGTLSDYTSLKIPKKYLNAAIKNKTPFSASMMENGTELSGWETYTPNSYDDIKMIYNNDLEMCIEILRPYYNADTATISHILYKITLSKAMNSIQYVKENYTEQVPDTEKETESTSPSEADMMVQAYIEATNKVSDEGLTLMQKVLLNKIDYNNGHKIEETKSIFYQNMNGTTFYIVDLDCDGNDEVCVNYYPGYVLIFHEIDKKIYGYERFYRDFSPVYKDGTFESTGGASVNSFRGKISFTESEFCYEIITWVETNYSDHVTHYYKNGAPHTDECVEITQEEYDEIMAGYTKEEAKEYDFTIENILKYVE